MADSSSEVPGFQDPIDAAMALLGSEAFFTERANTLSRIETKVSLGELLLNATYGKETYNSNLLDPNDQKVLLFAADFMQTELTAALEKEPDLIDYLAAKLLHPDAQVVFVDGVRKVEYSGFVRQGTHMQEFLRGPTSVRDWIIVSDNLRLLRNEHYGGGSQEPQFAFTNTKHIASMHLALNAYKNIRERRDSAGAGGQYI